MNWMELCLHRPLRTTYTSSAIELPKALVMISAYLASCLAGSVYSQSRGFFCEHHHLMTRLHVLRVASQILQSQASSSMRPSTMNLISRALQHAHRHLFSQRCVCKVFSLLRGSKSDKMLKIELRGRNQTSMNIVIPDLSTTMNTAPCNDPVEGSVKPSRMRSRESIIKFGLYDRRIVSSSQKSMKCFQSQDVSHSNDYASLHLDQHESQL